MIYVDTSVVLARLMAEERRPEDDFFDAELVTSRLTEYEVFVRLNAKRIAKTHARAARDLLARLSVVELTPTVLARALDPFPEPVRTLDALHLATMVHLRELGTAIELATYDRRMERIARKMAITIAAA